MGSENRGRAKIEPNFGNGSLLRRGGLAALLLVLAGLISPQLGTVARAAPDNTAPTISPISDQTIDEDNVMGPVSFDVNDAETAAAQLTVFAISSNTTLVPETKISLSGTGSSRTVTVTPVAEEAGTAFITIIVSDGQDTAQTSFKLTVKEINDPPTIGVIGDQVVEDGKTTPAIPFTVSDVDTALSSLILNGAAANPALVSISGFTFGGTETNRTLTIAPNAGVTGTTEITVSVYDGTSTVDTRFNLTVVGANQPPTISFIPNQTTAEDAPITVSFQVVDQKTPSDQLTYSATSSDQNVVGNAGLVLAGSGTTRSLTITPVNGASGSTNITIAVSDGEFTATRTFTLLVSKIDDKPVLANLPAQTTNEDTPIRVALTISDGDTPLANLSLTGTSTNQALVKNSNVVIRFEDGAYALHMTPEPNLAGTTVIVVTVSDGSTTVTDSFILTVVEVNDPPSIVPFGGKTIDEDAVFGPYTFIVQDPESTADLLTVTASSANTLLVANNKIALSGSGVARKVTITPEPNAHGTTLITLEVSDGQDSSTHTFLLTVLSVNDQPSMEDIQDVTTLEDEPVTITFRASDVETTFDQLIYSAESSNPTLLPPGNMKFSRTSTLNRLKLTPVAELFGTAVVTVTVSDGALFVQDSFVLTVEEVSDPPTITRVTNRSTPEGTPVTVQFSVADPDTPVHALQVTASSSNQAVVQDGNIVMSKLGGDWTAVVTPTPGRYGNVKITFTVSDGVNDVEGGFVLSVLAFPLIDAIPDQQTLEDTPFSIEITVGDPDTDVDKLTIQAFSDDKTLIPTSGIIVKGDELHRTLIIRPAPDMYGSTMITLTIRDATNATAEGFRVTVLPVNDPPVIDPIENHLMNQDTTSPIPVTVRDIDTPLEELRLSAVSSRPDLMPASRVKFEGTSGDRVATLAPIPGRSGESFMEFVVHDGSLSASTGFTLTVNGRPVFGNLSNVEVAEDSSETITIAVSDPDTNLDALGLYATSDNQTLLKDETLLVEGFEGQRVLTITPEKDQFGAATVTLFLDDGLITSTATFVVTVNPVNDGPSIGPINEQLISEDGVSGPVPFTVGDIDTDVMELTLSGVSSNPALVPLTGIRFSGEGINREITVRPAPDMYGSATISVTVSDGQLLASTSYLLEVEPVNDAPTIQPVEPVIAQEDTVVTIPVLLGDIDTPIGDVTLSATSDSQTIVRDDAIVVSGSGVERTLTITPMPDAVGILQISLLASDGNLTASSSFQLTFEGGNDGPVIAFIPDLEMPEDTERKVTFALYDIDTPLNEITLVYSSSNRAILPNANLSMDGNESERILHIQPAPNRTGKSTITIIASDGQWAFTQTFLVTILPVNDNPVAEDDYLQVITTPIVSIGVLANDRDIDRDPLRVMEVSGTKYGAVFINSDNTLRYQMPPGFAGTEVFSYTISDGAGGADKASVHITVIPPPGPNKPVIETVSPPVAANDRSTTVTINGRRFVPGVKLTVGPYPLLDVQVQDASTLRAVVPAFLPPDLYDIVITNPDGLATVRSRAFTVLPVGVAVSDVRPNRGRSHLPVTVNIYGLDFAPNAQAFLDETPLQTVHLNATHLQAHIPADVLPPGVYPVTVRNSQGVQATLPDAYTVVGPDDDDLFARGFEIWTLPTAVHVGQSVRVGVHLRRLGGVEPILDTPVDYFIGEPSFDSFIGRDFATFLDGGVGGDSTSGITWTPPAPGVYALYAVLDPDGEIAESNEKNNRIRREITVLPTEVDMGPPQIDELIVNDGLAATTQAEISLAVRAQDRLNDVRSVFFIEYLFERASSRWVPAQWSGWLDYDATAALNRYSWNLLPQPGARYIYAWASDAEGNLSWEPAVGLVNYLPPGNDFLVSGGVRLFRFPMRIGDQLSAFLLPESGDADLYAWALDHPSRPPWISNLATGVDELGLVAELDGDFQVEVTSFQNAVYRPVLEVRAIGPRTAEEAANNLDPSKPTRSQPYVPVAKLPSPEYALTLGLPPREDAIREQPAAVQPSLYLPLVNR